MRRESERICEILPSLAFIVQPPTLLELLSKLLPVNAWKKITDPPETGEGKIRRNPRSMFLTAVDEKENIDFVNCD